MPVKALAALLIFAGSAAAQDKAPAPPAAVPGVKGPALKAGDPAPAVSVEKFIKGGPVEGLEKGKVYVVEFWATWCTPCVRMFPHLSELQRRHKDKGLTIVGVNVWERSYGKGTLAKVEAFVERQAEKMSYTVAYDGEARAMDRAWMQAAGRDGIPSAFLVDGAGTIAMVGHPMFLEDVLPRVLAGTWDAKSDGAKVVRAEEAMTGKLDELAAAGDGKGVIARIEEMERDFPTVAAEVADVKARAYLGEKQYEKAFEVLAKMTDRAIAEKSAPNLNQIAWTIVDPKGGVEKPDLKLAARAAEKAVEFSLGDDAAILDTLARVRFLQGDVPAAVELQKRAVEKAPARERDNYRAALKEYEGAGKK